MQTRTRSRFEAPAAQEGDVAENPRAVAGNNRPPLDVEAVTEFEDKLKQRDGFEDAIKARLGSATRASCHDEDSAGRCTELVKQLSALERIIEDARESTKKPYFEAGKAIDAAARAKSAEITTAKQTVNGMLTTFIREENNRKQIEARRAEEARQAAIREAAGRALAEEAAPPPPPPPPAAPEPTQVRGVYGGVASGRKVWKHEILDFDVAYIAVAQNENVRAAIDKAVGAMVRSGMRTIEGVRVFEDLVAQVR